LLAHGDVGDVTSILQKIAGTSDRIEYQNHMGLCLIAKRQMLQSSAGLPEIYINWTKAREFWKYLSHKEKSSMAASDLLPLENPSNRPLFLRILAYAVVGLTRLADDALLRSLLHHSFTTIAGAAAIRMSELMGDPALSAVSTEIDQAIGAGHAKA